MLIGLFMTVSLQFSLPPDLLSAMCFVESGHRTEAINRHDKGRSIGVCQVKLKTAKFMGFKGTEAELMEPEVNVYYAGKYLRHCYDRYENWAKAVTCYNKGHSSGHGGSEYVGKVFNRLLNQ